VEGVDPWRVRELYLFWTDNPDYWEDITCYLDARIAALMRHASQIGLDEDKLVERVRQRAREAGERPDYAFAEAFKRIEL
jgi:LmbE family N-acetylglucosaminyl deacetylase